MSQYKAQAPSIVYHTTTKESGMKIIEFGFDLDLAGQSTILAFKKRGDVIIDDKFMIDMENMLEHSVINTRTSYEECVGYGDSLLRITLKDGIKLLDTQKIPRNLRKHKWRKMFALAKENGYDGISNGNYIMIFKNRKIEKIERVKKGDVEFNDFMGLSLAYKARLDLYKMHNKVIVNHNKIMQYQS